MKLALDMGSPVARASLLMTDDDIKSLFPAPVTIVPAQGAGTIIFPISASIVWDFTEGAYSPDTTDDHGLWIGYDSGILLKWGGLWNTSDSLNFFNSFLTVARSGFSGFFPDAWAFNSTDIAGVTSQIVQPLVNAENVPLTFGVNGGFPDGGNTANWLRVNIIFTSMSLLEQG